MVVKIDWVIHVSVLNLLLIYFFKFFVVNFYFFYRQHIHHITCTEQDKHIISVNDSYCYWCAQHITTFFLKSIINWIFATVPIVWYFWFFIFSQSQYGSIYSQVDICIQKTKLGGIRVVVTIKITITIDFRKKVVMC
jgi:hypothetical protein